MKDVDEIQRKFINTMTFKRKSMNLYQSDIKLPQKAVSRVENHEVNPRLSTVIQYLLDLGYDINDIFKE